MTPSSPVTTPPSPATSALSVQEAAEQRHSIRKYRPVAIPESDLRELLRLVSLAPSANNLQPWRFVVVREPELKSQLHAAAYQQAQVLAAPAVIVLYTDMVDTLDTVDEVIHPGLPEARREATKAGLQATFAPMSEADREAWAAAQGHITLGYLVLAAQAMGYATSAMAGFEPEKVKQVLGLPAHVKIPALIALGVADEPGFPTHRHAVDRIAAFR